MKKYLFLISVFFLLIAPIFIYFVVKDYYAYYDKLAKSYECYPMENCQVDIDGDSVFDSIKITRDMISSENPYNHPLIIISLKKDIEEVELLRLKCECADYTFRSYLAFFEEENKRKLVIYDTINENQFFYWNGQKLIPSTNPSELELEIRKAFRINDETGGFYLKMFFEALSIPFLVFYYLCLLILLSIFEYKKRKRISLN